MIRRVDWFTVLLITITMVLAAMFWSVGWDIAQR